ncbi:MAG: hypothetical protein ACE5J2_09030 [Nitrososphaerales archaeon]
MVMNRILLVDGGYSDEAPQYEFGPDLPESEEEDEIAKFYNKYRKKFNLKPL